MTKELENDDHNVGLTQSIAAKGPQAVTGKWVSGKSVNYDDSAKVNLLWDGLGALTNGAIGHSPIDAFLGSYTEKYRIAGYDPKTGVETVDFEVTNGSTWQSFLHFMVNDPSYNVDSGAGASINETFDWTEQIHVGPPLHTPAAASGSAFQFGGGGGHGGGSGGGGGGSGASIGDGVYTGGGGAEDGVYYFNPGQGQTISC
jgi:hypothetical protein